MARKIPSHVKKSLEEGVAEIKEAIQDEKRRDLIGDVIESYSKLDKGTLSGKITYLASSLRRLCGPKGTELIMNLLSRGSSPGSWKLVGEVKDTEVKHFLETIVMKYGAQYQWFLDPFRSDWERYEFSTEYKGAPSLPIISMRIVNKSGRVLELESPLTTYVDLVIAQVKHLQTIDDEMADLGQPHSVQKIVSKKKLGKMKKAVEKLLERTTTAKTN